MTNYKTNEFDVKAKEWENNPEHVHRAQVLAEAIVKELPPGLSFNAMEYGCGTGMLSFHLKDKFSKITLIDTSDGMLEVLRNKIKGSGVTNMDVLDLDLLEQPDGISTPFSVIYTSMVLHHIDDINGILTTWYSLLNRPGYLCVADLDAEEGNFHGKDFKGHNGFDRDELKKTAEAAGFSNVTFRTVLEIKKTASDGAFRSYPVFLMVAEKPR
jgi:2-polyprenyl-3-methyl-5-hydroxy-6-metoxy-1,4-benzoquinol methylase